MDGQNQNKTDRLLLFIPLIYLGSAAAISGVFHYIGVPPEMTALIVGAALTRVKVVR